MHKGSKTSPLFHERHFKHCFPSRITLTLSKCTSSPSQNIATENNLSETAFLKSIGANQYEIRWFSPITEIDFCGHATLASSLVLFDELGMSGTIEFHTLEVGTLTVEKNAQGKIEMTFPARPPKAVSDIPSALIEGLSCNVERVLLSPQAYFVVVGSQQEVLEVQALKVLGRCCI